MSNLSNLSVSRGAKKQTIDMFSSADGSLASASDLHASGFHSRDLAGSNAEGGTSSRYIGSVITPRYLLDSADPNGRKIVIDDRSSKMEDIKESGSYIDD